MRNLLSQFGWTKKGNKWTSSGHSRPLTTEQAKNALARDLGAKDFKSATKRGLIEQTKSAIARGFEYREGKLYKGARGRKGYTPEQALAIAEREERKAAPKALPDTQANLAQPIFSKPAKPADLSDYFSDPDLRSTLEDHFYAQARATFGNLSKAKKEAIAIYFFKKNDTGSDRWRQYYLERLLIESGFRRGNEPWPAGQTPRGGRR